MVYEDVMDAKQACDKLNGFNFQNRYLVGTLSSHLQPASCNFSWPKPNAVSLTMLAVLYHQPEKMVSREEDIAERERNLEELKRQHGIE